MLFPSFEGEQSSQKRLMTFRSEERSLGTPWQSTLLKWCVAAGVGDVGMTPGARCGWASSYSCSRSQAAVHRTGPDGRCGCQSGAVVALLAS